MIKLSNLSKYYYSGNSVALGLRKVNLEFSEKEFVVITGESGSGKTTLLSTISGLLSYEEGELYIEGKPTSHFDEEDWENYRREHIAFVFQNYNLIDSYTVLENVMAVLVIQGTDLHTAKQTALKYLEKVGLIDYITHHASELSSGQKQRLSIARALAKDTKIIVADEPTGNLDAENGKQVMELLSKLAQDRLVLVVTHNYEEAAPFATRKVRIYDGEIVEDIQIKRKDETVKTEEAISVSEADKDEEIQADISKTLRLTAKKISNVFTRLELRSRKKKGFLFTSLMFFVAVSTFLFFGNLIANLDDTSTRIYTNEAFLNTNERRIAVRHPDGSAITDADVEIIRQIQHVAQVEQYGLASDIYYFCEEGKDYEIKYHHENAGMTDDPSPIYSSTVYLKEYTKFFHSSSALKESDLAYGRLPQNVNEVVIYSDDPAILGTTFDCYFSDLRNWKLNTYCTLEMTVCGILKEETSQYYFSEDIAKMLSLSAYENFNMGYAINYMYHYVGENGGDVFHSYGGKFEDVIFYTDATYQQDTDNTSDDPYQIVISARLMKKSESVKFTSFSIKWYFDETGYDYHGYHFIYSSDRVFPIGNATDLEGKGSIAKIPHKSSENFICVSKELFDVIASSFDSPQASIYVSDYAYVDDVIKELYKNGYEAVSPYRISAVAYDPVKVNERLVTLGVSLGALIVMMVLEFFVLKAFLKNGESDCVILKSIGMPQQILSKVQRNTLLWYCLIGYVLMLAVAMVLNFVLPQVHALVVYYRIHHWIILLGINVGVVLLTTFSYNRYLKRLLVAGIE